MQQCINSVNTCHVRSGVKDHSVNERLPGAAPCTSVFSTQQGTE